MKFGVLVFPGTWSDRDCGWVIDQVLGVELQYLWHKDADLKGCDCIILPGGFAYGDYLRTGAIARFAPIMEKVGEFAERGGLVWGICNGFQILCEAGLLPGALLRNASLEFRCQWTNLVVERTDLAFTSQCSEREVIRVPISHGEGSYFADPATLSRLEQSGQVVFRYSDEDTCAAHGMDDKVSALVSANRARKLLALQRGIARQKNQALIGSELEVLVEGPSEDHELVMKGRHPGQAPEIDGSVYLSEGEAHAGEMRRVRVVQASDWDLVGELISDADEAPRPAPARRVSLKVVGARETRWQ